MDTWDGNVVTTKVTLTKADGTTQDFETNSGAVPSPYAEDVRDGEYSAIDVYLVKNPDREESDDGTDPV